MIINFKFTTDLLIIISMLAYLTTACLFFKAISSLPLKIFNHDFTIIGSPTTITFSYDHNTLPKWTALLSSFGE